MPWPSFLRRFARAAVTTPDGLSYNDQHSGSFSPEYARPDCSALPRHAPSPKPSDSRAARRRLTIARLPRTQRASTRRTARSLDVATHPADDTPPPARRSEQQASIFPAHDRCNAMPAVGATHTTPALAPGRHTLGVTPLPACPADTGRHSSSLPVRAAIFSRDPQRGSQMSHPSFGTSAMIRL